MIQLSENTNSPEQHCRSGPMSTNGPPVQPYSILLLALGSCYHTGPGGRMTENGVAAPVGEDLDTRAQDAERLVYNLAHITLQMIIIQLPLSVFSALLLHIYIFRIFRSTPRLTQST